MDLRAVVSGGEFSGSYLPCEFLPASGSDISE